MVRPAEGGVVTIIATISAAMKASGPRLKFYQRGDYGCNASLHV